MALEDLTGQSILFVVQNAVAPRTGETGYHDRLETAGATCDFLSASSLDSSSADGYDLVIISSSPASSDVGSNLLGVAVPIVIHENFAYDDMNLATTPGFTSDEDTITITDDTHPIASNAGFSNGTVTVYTTSSGPFIGVATGLGGDAATFATFGGDPTCFTYDTGDDLTTGTAAARRACITNEDDWRLSTDGLALVDGAVNWALDLLGGASAQSVTWGVLDGTPVSDDAALEHSVVWGPLDGTPASDVTAMEHSVVFGALDGSPTTQGSALEHSLVFGVLDGTPTSQGAFIQESATGDPTTNEFTLPRTGRRQAAGGLIRRN